MNDEEFEKYLERIEELYKIGKLCENPTISVHIVHSKIRKQKIKQILEEIYQKGYTQCEIDIANDGRYSLREEAKP